MSKGRQQYRTLFLVGEGHAEEAFLNYLKSQLIKRGSGLKVIIKNAKGKGAKHVVNWTIRQSKSISYNTVAVLLDTDTDWTPAVIDAANNNNIIVLKSEPCFEAMLLRLYNITPERDSKKLKNQFAYYVNNDPLLPGNYDRYFNVAELENKRQREKTIDDLLKLLQAG